jgi:TolB-like protein
MSSVSRALFVALFFALSTLAAAQDNQARINGLLAEIDASDIEHNTTQIANEAAALTYSKFASAAILPFRDNRNRRTGLTEFITAEFGKKLALTPAVEIMPANQVAGMLSDQFNLTGLRWPQEGANVAARLGVASLVRGRLIDGAEAISLTVEIYSAEKNAVVAALKTSLPRTADLSRLMELVVNESPAPKTETPPQPQPSPAPSASTPTVTTALEIAIRGLADKLAARLAETKQVRVGILEFLDLQGRISQLGKFIGEDLTTAFFEKGKFSLVERSLLQQVMREHALTQSGMIDITQAQEIGKAVGAEAIITGSLSDIGNEIKANARLIDVRAGTVLAVAGENIAKTENVAKMFNTILWSPDGKASSPLPSKPSPTPSAPAGYVFFEDFQNVQEGMLPSGWLGGEKLMVKSDGRQKFVTDFERQESHKVLIDNVTFTENFEFTTVFQFGDRAYGTQLLASLGSLTMTIDVNGWYRLNNTKVDKNVEWRGQIVKTVLTKEGPLFKLFVNGEEVLLVRDTNYKLPQAIALEIRNQSGFKLMQVGLRAL